VHFAKWLVAVQSRTARKVLIFRAIVIFASILRKRAADSLLTSLYPEGGLWIPAMHSSTRANLHSAMAVRPANVARACCCTIAILVSLSSGCCSTGYLTLRTLVCEPSKYCFKIDRIRSKSVYHRWADEEWERAVQSGPDFPVSAAYHAGFVDGFVDYVYLGGIGEPPPIPPRQFWNVEGRSPEGKAMANDWFAGFRHGSRMGAEGGYRVLATLHTSFGDGSDLPPGDVVPGPMNYGIDAPAAEALPAPAAASPANQPPIPPQTPAESSAPLVPNDLPLDSVPPNAEMVPPPVDATPEMPMQGDGAALPRAPGVVNPFRTTEAKSMTSTVMPAVDMRLELPVPPEPSGQPTSTSSEALTPEPLDLPAEALPPAKLASDESALQSPVAAVPDLPLPAVFAATPDTADESWVKPTKKRLSKAELLKLTAGPVPLDQPEEIEQYAETQTIAELQPVAVKRDERTVREKNRAAYFAK
jgi:hypothetical protein